MYSIIIPTYNEEKNLGSTLNSIVTQTGRYEILIADGGSTDNTAAIGAQYGAAVLKAPKGRGRQCHFGAEKAVGDILIFLHADTLFPEGGFAVLDRFFKNRTNRIGVFKMVFNKRSPALDMYGRLTRFDSLFTSFGDRGLVLRKDFYHTIGGFPLWPIFEDVKILQKARKHGPVKILPATVVTSARMFEQKGHFFQMLRNIYLFLRYLAGTSPNLIYKKYYKKFKQ